MLTGREGLGPGDPKVREKMDVNSTIRVWLVIQPSRESLAILTPAGIATPCGYVPYKNKQKAVYVSISENMIHHNDWTCQETATITASDKKELLSSLMQTRLYETLNPKLNDQRNYIFVPGKKIMNFMKLNGTPCLMITLLTWVIWIFVKK